MKTAAWFFALVLWIPLESSAFVVPSDAPTVSIHTRRPIQQQRQQQPLPQRHDISLHAVSGRRSVLEHLLQTGGAMAGGCFWSTATSTLFPSSAWADVSDGNALPQGAQQFAKAIKLQTDLKDVVKRLETASDGDIEPKEWENIGKFLRNIYSIADNDMKAIAKGIYNSDKQKTANDSIEQIKKLAQAGDLAVAKQNRNGLVTILEKISGLVGAFFDALSDVPDEL